MRTDKDDDKPSAPSSQHENEELSPEEDLDSWTNEVQGVSFVAKDEGDTLGALPCQLPPKESNPGSFTLPCTIGEPNETIILGRPFLATIHAHIDVFKREILLGIGEDRVKFDMDGGISHSRIHVEKIYMESSFHEEEYFNPLEIKNDVFSYEYPICLLFKQRTQSYDNESVDTLDSAGSVQGLEDNHVDVVRTLILERIVSRWHVYKPVRVFYDNVCGKDCGMWPTCNPDLSFCSGYDAIYGKERMRCSNNRCAFGIMKYKVLEEIE
nr:hypothetical protein [Tanacetum cinerariifolium]